MHAHFKIESSTGINCEYVRIEWGVNKVKKYTKIKEIKTKKFMLPTLWGCPGLL